MTKTEHLPGLGTAIWYSRTLPAMAGRISTFKIAADEPGSEKSKGTIVPCEPLSDPEFRGRLVQHKNYRGFAYEENHLEEWIAREPTALFGATPVLLLVSQNYVHLRVKIDLLFVDDKCRLFPVELKVVKAAKNGGVVPYDLFERQMRPYTQFLTAAANLAAFNSEYARFVEAFYHSRQTLSEAFSAKFGHTPANVTCRICEVYVAEDFDDYALDYFAAHSSEQNRSVRLISYRFFPQYSYIEFWNLYESSQEHPK